MRPAGRQQAPCRVLRCKENRWDTVLPTPTQPNCQTRERGLAAEENGRLKKELCTPGWIEASAGAPFPVGSFLYSLPAPQETRLERQRGLTAQNSRYSSAERRTACGLLGHAEPRSGARGASGPESSHGRDRGRRRPGE
ncbi:hypothetical protein NDU88_009002 [Pleurodeles waltl]|uniref:Uncharacterized protein n=1 Tax=Pleurodeles waltl TaxID=8319 RepID=A0AAV7PR72_PLEWA|nr:hypothetical protein NDU88_009002 [Pleurodeles waltl]